MLPRATSASVSDVEKPNTALPWSSSTVAALATRPIRSAVLTSSGLTSAFGRSVSSMRAAIASRLSRALDQLLERRLIADRIEVRIILCVRPTPLRAVDCETEVLDRVGRPAREALATGEVVEQPGVLRMSLDELASALGRLGVLAGAVERVQRRPELPAVGLVRLSRRAAER